MPELRRRTLLATSALLMLLLTAACSDGRPDLGSPAARERGRRLFVTNCGLCHGPAADGEGVRAPALSTPPTDFTDPEWREEASPGEVYRAIQEGVEDTAMPAWNMFTEEETWDLTAYLLSVAEEGAYTGSTPPPSEEVP